MAFAKKGESLTAHEKAARRVATARKKLTTAARDVNVGLNLLAEATAAVEEAHNILALEQAAGHVGREFSVGMQASRGYLARLVFESMVEKGIPTIKHYAGNAAVLLAPIAAMERNLENLELRDPAGEAERKADIQAKWEVEQIQLVEESDNASFVLSALATVAGDGTLTQDELPAAVQEWLQDELEKDVSRAFIKHVMKERGYFDPNVV